jgi:hypothetical protein
VREVWQPCRSESEEWDPGQFDPDQVGKAVGAWGHFAQKDKGGNDGRD